VVNDRSDPDRSIPSGAADDTTSGPTLSGDGHHDGSSRTSLPAGAPRRIGSYVIKREIASGGMGTVFEALQENPRRPVAVKVIKESLASESAVGRLEYEAQILARLRHPGIAQIYEAGWFEDRCSRVPFFAMEYIPNARSITSYAEDRQLDHRQRLELFLQVCDAVHHGHQRGAVHRDLKPSNILVDSSGRVRVIDFGVARAIDADTKRAGADTEYGRLVGSVLYMSPEQFDADPHDIDTRSDVYALGVVLYELLTGTLPYQTKSGSVFDIAHEVRHGQPVPLSSRGRELRGDVEAIVHKAHQKDRERRYQSAHGLALDIQRFLAGDAVTAHAPGFSYQLLVFARRNRALIGGVAAAFVLLAASTVITAFLLVRVDAERERAEIESRKATAGREFLTEVLASAVPPGYGDTTTVADVLDTASERVDGAFPDDPEVEAEIQSSLGQGYLSVSHWRAAREHLREALGLRRQALGPSHDKTIQSMVALLRLYQITDDRQAELELSRELDQVLTERYGNESEDVLSVRSSIASHLEGLGELEAAVEAAHESLQAHRRVFGNDAEATVHDQSQYAWLLMRSGDLEQAKAVARDAVDRSVGRLGRTHWATRAALSALAAIHISQGEIDEAKELYGHRRLPEGYIIEHEFQGSFVPGASPFQLLVFFEEWCPFSQRAIPTLGSIHREYRSTGLEVVGFTQVTRSASNEKVERMLDSSDVEFVTVKEDGRLRNHFGCEGVPSLRLLHEDTLIWEDQGLSSDRIAPSMLEGMARVADLS
jgi:thiol-disulfide isomerase/thioredoxin